ncbi:MAG: hypothetical protein ACI82I_003473, partial [Gammaproteobacteria bacterium]
KPRRPTTRRPIIIQRKYRGLFALAMGEVPYQINMLLPQW